MTVSEAKIPREAADGAREEVEKHNEDTIADAKAAGTPSSPIVRLRGSDTLVRLQQALKDFSIAYQAQNPGSSISYKQIVLFLRRPPSDPPVMDVVYGCLALGKIGGGKAEELDTGHAFVWKPGERHLFGDAGAIYVAFEVVEKSG